MTDFFKQQMELAQQYQKLCTEFILEQLEALKKIK